ncbi:MAG: 23S rRNA (adenine(2030)-N(6))-methyltransferase RlmJ, partial [Methylobacteriaceae bacterium]|nr:23S rRNA (adenine(2030)-N(6))-methyltransferase RlmJ [Methylobacteriaceae bacterium]
DTHAGIGRYDLAGDEALRTGEAAGGVARMSEPFPPAVEEVLAPWRKILAETRGRYGDSVYPGSPAIVRELLRQDDRAVFVEKHPDDARTLTERFGAVRTTKVLTLDGWTALRSLIPPPERRGLVLVDPPYEEPAELDRAVARLADAHRKWPTGILALWYPIKHAPDTDRANAALAARAPDAKRLRLELTITPPVDRTRLAGSGLLLVNAPWRLRSEAETILPALAQRLSAAGTGAVRIDGSAEPPASSSR